MYEIKVKLEDIKIPQNYVLVIPDDSFDKFQDSEGKDFLDVNERGPIDSYATHLPIRGKVYGIPDRLMYNGYECLEKRIPVPDVMTDFAMAQFYFKSFFTEMNDLKRASVKYDVDLDVEVGDMVFFKYQEHFSCYQEGRWLSVEGYGEMMLIRYDALICKHPEYIPERLTMLNGYLLLEPLSPKTVFGESIFRKGGLFLADITDREKIAMKKKWMIGIVRHLGKPSRHFLENSGEGDGVVDIEKDDIVIYNPKMATSIEYELHETHFEGFQLIKLHRRDIFGRFSKEVQVSLSSLITDAFLN